MNLNLNFDKKMEAVQMKVEAKPIYRDFREGDVRHSLADISKSKSLLGYAPQYRIEEGLKEAMTWYVENN